MRRHGTKFSELGDLAPVICAPMIKKVYKNPVLLERKIYYASITESEQLLVFGETIAENLRIIRNI
jgi:hypothetical protein